MAKISTPAMKSPSPSVLAPRSSGISKKSPSKTTSSPQLDKQAENFLGAVISVNEYDSEQDAPGEDDPDLAAAAPAEEATPSEDAVAEYDEQEDATGDEKPEQEADTAQKEESDGEAGEDTTTIAPAAKKTASRVSRKGKVTKPTARKAAKPATTSSTETRTYNRGVGTAVRSNAKLPSMVLGAIEILTYFPHHVRSPDLLFRLYRAQWSTRYIAKAQLHARGALDLVELNRRDASMRHKITVAGKEKFGADFTCTKYQNHADLQPVQLDDFAKEKGFPNGILEHYDVSDAKPSIKERNISDEPETLKRLAEGVVNHPEGEHRGLLAQAIEWAGQQCPAWEKPDGEMYTTDDVVEIVRVEGFEVPDVARTAQWDLAGAVWIQGVPNPS